MSYCGLHTNVEDSHFALMYTYKFPRPQVAVDSVIFGLIGDLLQILLVRRATKPFAGQWALPGRIVRIDESQGGGESLEEAAQKALRKAGIRDVYMEQLYTFGATDRDPSGRVVSVAYYALVKPSALQLAPGEGASDVRWFPIDKVPALAFDHAEILDKAYERLRTKVRYQPLGFELLPESFTLSELQMLYERILGQPLDKRNFRKWILARDLLKPLDRHRQTRGRPAQLYRYDKRRYKKLTHEGFDYPLRPS